MKTEVGLGSGSGREQQGTALYFLVIAVIFLYVILFVVTPEAEKFNGWMAMLGFVAALGAYATTGQIIPGIF